MTVSLADIEAAAERIAGKAVRTPIIESVDLSARIGARILIKPELMQHAGAFKFRGAYNRLSQLDADQRTRGVVAFSSGNHAQGVALAAQMLGMPALIVMPADAPSVKIEGTRGYGAEVHLYDRMTEDRVAIAQKIAAERGAVVVPAFDDADIVAGQGTIGLELFDQAAELGLALDLVIAPVSGGGLLAGIATAVSGRRPDAQFVGVEPAGFDDLAQSLGAGRRLTLKPTGRSLCDALESPSTGEITFPILQRTVSSVVAVSDAEVAEAMRYAFDELNLRVEPSGAVGLAALLAGTIPVRTGATVGLVLSGGNVDPDLFDRVMRKEI